MDHDNNTVALFGNRAGSAGVADAAESDQPFALNMPMVVAAAVSPEAQRSIESFLHRGRVDLRQMVFRFLRWLDSPCGTPEHAGGGISPLHVHPAPLQRGAVAVRHVRRGDDSAEPARVWRLAVRAGCGRRRCPGDAGVLRRSAGAVLPRPRVRCGDQTGANPSARRRTDPVAIVRVPRERMVGSGIASSLVHEVGHQAAALLDLVGALRPTLRAMQAKGGAEKAAWELWERWISEIVADLWSVGRVGIASTSGLINVVSLPRPFVFRINTEDPHPAPWIRVLLSCSMGHAMFPHPQWRRLARLWQSYYPLGVQPAGKEALIRSLLDTMPTLASLLVSHRPAALKGRTIAEALGTHERQPLRLRALWRWWRHEPRAMRAAKPSLVFAVIGQARVDHRISPEMESSILGHLLSHWALVSTFNPTQSVSSMTAAVRIGNEWPPRWLSKHMKSRSAIARHE